MSPLPALPQNCPHPSSGPLVFPAELLADGNLTSSQPYACHKLLLGTPSLLLTFKMGTNAFKLSDEFTVKSETADERNIGFEGPCHKISSCLLDATKYSDSTKYKHFQYTSLLCSPSRLCLVDFPSFIRTFYITQFEKR